MAVKTAKIDATASGDNTVVAAVAGYGIQVLSYDLVTDGAVAAYWRDGTGGTALSGAKSFAANGGETKGYNPHGHVRTSPGNALVLNLSGATAARGELTYRLTGNGS